MDTSVIGVFSTCTQDVCLVAQGTRQEVVSSIEKRLDVSVYECLINGSILVGSLCRGNSNGFFGSRRHPNGYSFKNDRKADNGNARKIKRGRQYFACK